MVEILSWNITKESERKFSWISNQGSFVLSWVLMQDLSIDSIALQNTWNRLLYWELITIWEYNIFVNFVNSNPQEVVGKFIPWVEKETLLAFALEHKAVINGVRVWPNNFESI